MIDIILSDCAHMWGGLYNSIFMGKILQIQYLKEKVGVIKRERTPTKLSIIHYTGRAWNTEPKKRKRALNSKGKGGGGTKSNWKNEKRRKRRGISVKVVKLLHPKKET